MKPDRIRTDWAALSVAHDGAVVVCAKHNEICRCICFGSLEQLKKAIDSRRMSARKWVTAVPRSSCILRPLALPASDMNEAVKMVEFEMPSLVPLPLEEIVYGCMPLGRQDGMIDVLVCILKLNTLNHHLRQLATVGIEPQRIVLDSLAVQDWFGVTDGGASHAAISAFVSERRCVILTSIDGYLQKASEMTSSGGDAAAVSRQVVQEILDQREDMPASRCKGTMTLLAGSQEYVSEVESQLRLVRPRPVTANNVAIVPSPGIIGYEDIERKTGENSLCYETILTIGLLDLAMNSKLPFFNLLPQKHLQRFERRALLFNYVFAGLAASLLVVLLWVCLWTMNRRIERKSRQIEAQIAPIEHIADTVERKRQHVKAIQRQLSARGLITQVFLELYKYTPKNVSISELRFLPKGGTTSIEIKGRADLIADAYEYAEAMRSARLLRTMEILDAQHIPKHGGSVGEFKARCLIPSE